MSTFNQTYGSLLFTIVLLFFVSCHKDNSNNRSETKSDGQIRLNVNIPGAVLPVPMTKSGQTAEESQINEIQILVFENGLYSYRTNGANIVQSDGTASFSARLSPSSTPTTLYLIANNNNNIAEPGVGTSLNDLTTFFTIPYPATGMRGNGVLWGSYHLPNGITNTLEEIPEPITLLRALARVDVEVASNVTNFRLQTIQVFRGSNTIQVIPNQLDVNTPITTPSIPSNNLYNVTTNPVNTTSTLVSRGQIYLPESAAPTVANQVSQATCIVIGGSLNNAATRFYRLDFNPQLLNYPLGQILRNGRYVFTITGVVGAGQTTAALAASNASSNTNVTLVTWPADNINYMYFDNTHFFGLSTLEVGLNSTINSTANIDVETSVNSFLFRFGTVGAWQQSLNNGIFSVERTNANRRITITALSNNLTNTRQQVLQVQASTIIAPITIQIIQPAGTPNLEWATRNVGAFRTFVTNIQDFGAHFQWDRTTSFPANGDQGTPAGWNNTLLTTLNWSAANNPCPVGWQIPTNEDWAVFRIMYPARSIRATGTLAAPGNGTWFAPTQAAADAATFANPGTAIFLPSAGWRQTNGAHAFGSNNGEFGFYWCFNRTPTGLRVFQLGSGTGIMYAVANQTAYSVRCVRYL